MFYFSINASALKTIKTEAKSTDREIIGVLIGRVYDNLLVVTKAVSGNQASGLTRVKLDNSTMAKIVSEIMAGKLEGNILGWYHSHPGFGVFMSSTDIGTQQALQQFSPKVAALVIDPKEDNYGVFTLDPNLGVLQIPDEQIFSFKDGEDGIPEVLKDIHSFSVKMEIGPEAAVDRIRYIIECTKAYWPEKNCLICGSDLHFDEKGNRWICPSMESSDEAVPEEPAEGVSATRTAKSKGKIRKFKKVLHTCKRCNVELKHSKKLNAWYCNKCRRVYKHRVKVREDQSEAGLEKGEEPVPVDDMSAASVPDKTPPGEAEALSDQDVIVEAVETRMEPLEISEHESITESDGDTAVKASLVQEKSETRAPETASASDTTKSEVETEVKNKIKKAASKKQTKRKTKKAKKKIVKRSRKSTKSNK